MEYYYRELNSELNRLYRDKIQIDRKEGKKYKDFAFSNVDKILEYINKNDPRFSREPVRAGSYWQGLRVEKADEYDYSIVLTDLDKLTWGNYASTLTPKYYGFNQPIPADLDTIPGYLDILRYRYPTLNNKPESQFPQEAPLGYCFAPLGNGVKWHQKDDLVRDNDIVPFLVHRQLKRLLTDARRDLNLKGEIHQDRKINRPAITMRFIVGTREVNIDFAPMIRAHLPFKESFQWPHYGARWPSMEKVEAIKKIGINLIAKKDFWWMYVFVEAEKELVSGIDSDDGKRKETHRLMKMINRDIWCPTTKSAITSYILKNVWYWEMEHHPDSRDWQTSELATRVLSMTDRVITGIRTRTIPQYFQPAFNLLASKDSEQLDKALEKIWKFQNAPLEHIQKLLLAE